MVSRKLYLSQCIFPVDNHRSLVHLSPTHLTLHQYSPSPQEINKTQVEWPAADVRALGEPWYHLLINVRRGEAHFIFSGAAASSQQYRYCSCIITLYPTIAAVFINHKTLNATITLVFIVFIIIVIVAAFTAALMLADSRMRVSAVIWPAVLITIT